MAIAKAAVETHQLVRVDLAVSRDPLGKQGIQRPLFEHRVEILESHVDSHEWLGLVITDSQLVVDIADGYDLVVMGADKWDQVNDVSWYEGEAERDQALSRLPTVAVAPRPPFPTPLELELTVPDEIAEVSSTGARDGVRSWMVGPAADFDEATGAWTDPDRYEKWIARN